MLPLKPDNLGLEFPEVTVHREKLSCYFHTYNMTCADGYVYVGMCTYNTQNCMIDNDLLTYKGTWQSVNRKA